MAKPSVKQKNNKSNIFVRAINKFSNLHAPAKVLILAVMIGVFGGGSYAVYISSAAGWTTVGTMKAKQSDSIYVEGTVQACKKSIPKRGYAVISRYKINAVKGTPPQVRAIAGVGAYNYYSDYTASKIGSVLTTQASNYVSSSTYVHFSAQFAPGPGSSSTAITGTVSSKQISSLSTCP